MAKQAEQKSPAPRKKSAPVRKQSVDVSQNMTNPSISPRAMGVNVSLWNGTVSWDRVRASGHSFAFIKATQSSAQVDNNFSVHWAGAKQAGVLRGAFHVFDPEVDPQVQADHFIKTILSRNDAGELPPVLDLEPFETKDARSLSDVVKVWLDAVESAFQRKPMIYSNPQTLQSKFVSADGSVPPWVKDYPLWIAQYLPSEYTPATTPSLPNEWMTPSIPSGWTNWAFWQFTDKGSVDGMVSNADLNAFNGTEEYLRQFASSPTAALKKLRLNFALNDRPQGPDRLDYEKYADAFAQVLSGQYTQTPLTVGIYASWGMGKSFLLGKIREKLEAIKKQNDQLDFAFIDFNAWVYSGSENLWAGLVTTLYDGIEKHYETKGDRLVQDYRRRESLKQLWRTFNKSLMLALVFGVPAAIISILLDYQSIQENWKSVIDIFLLILGGAPLLSKIPDLLKGLKSLIDSVVLLRSQELAKLSSRKDFRDQVGFMADIQSELRHISDLIKELDKKKKQKTRFIIFVDDLDRCSPGKAVEVLEAIMLLLSDRTEDPFIIFLAMDARVLVKAVEMRYGEVLKESGISGYEFLDKIVQIPFRIPPANDDSIKKYVKSLLYQSLDAQTKAEQPIDDKAMTEAPGPSGDEGKGDAGQPGEKAPRTTPKPVAPAEPSTAAVTVPPEEEPFTQPEKDAFEGYSKFVSRNPRRVKRIVNIYRLVRILLNSDISPQTAIKWVILTEQWPFRIAWVMQKIEDDIQLGHEISLDDSLADIYQQVRGFVEDEKSHLLALLDEDAENFEAFIYQSPDLTVGEIHKLWAVTFNLNPAMQNEVLKSALQNGNAMRSEAAPEEMYEA